MTDAKKTARFIIHGRVQGVFFRDTARQVARRLDIQGSAINLLDGTVEIVAEGTPEAVKKFQSWLMIGPDMATVENVEVVGIEYHLEFNDFKIG